MKPYGTWISIILFGLLSVTIPMGWAYDRPVMLLLQSYRPTYEWSRNIGIGVVRQLKRADVDVDLKIEYMDISNNKDAAHFDLLLDLYRHKYRPDQFKVILCADNYALSFLLSHREQLFPKIPIVFCGINRFNDALTAGHDNITGVVEDFDLKATVEVMLELHKNPDAVAIWSVVHKRTTQSRAKVVSMIKKRSPDTKIVHIRDKNLQQGMAILEQMKGKCALLMLSVVKDDNGMIIPVDVTARTISQGVDIPIYSLWDFFLGHGIVGGKLISGVEQGRNAADQAVALVKGTPMSKIPIIRRSPNRFMFDYHQLQRFQIDWKRLPEDRVIINTPQSFYSQYKHLVWGVSAVIITLCSIVILLAINIHRRIKAEKSLQKAHDQLEIRVKDRTHDLYLRNEVADILLNTEGDLIYSEILSLILKEFESSFGYFGYIDESGDFRCPSLTQDVWEVCEISDKDIVFPKSNWGGLWGRSLKEKTLLVANHPLSTPKGHVPLDRAVVCPIIHHTELVGHMGLANRSSDYLDDDLYKLRKISDYIAPLLKERLEKEKVIRQRQQAQEDLRRQRDELKEALDQVKTLSGLIPICSGCKKIRNDEGYWTILEAYFQEHANASFSHGICPECKDKMYGDQKWYKDMKKRKEQKK